eukprot:199931_1
MDEKDDLGTLRRELNEMKRKNKELESRCTSLQRQVQSNMMRTKHSDAFWEEVEDKCRSDPDYIKSLIKENKIQMTDLNKNKQTLLLVAAYRGSYDIVNLCLNLGADLHHQDKNKETAIDLCRQGAYYHVEQLLLFASLNANSGNQIRDTAHNLKKQKGVLDNIMHQLSSYDTDDVSWKEVFCDTLTDLMIHIINQKLAFSDDLLNLCFHFELHDGKDILSTKLWHALSKTCTDIIQNGNKKQWFWLKTFILPSTVWFIKIKNVVQEHGESKQDEALTEETDESCTYLYYELLKLVEGQAKEQLNTLACNLNELANKNKDDWNALVKWEIPDADKDIKQPRQDKVPNAIIPRYTEKELSEQGSSSSSFNSHTFYDYYEYLPQLVLLAQIVDDEFQNSVQKIFNIDKKIKQGTIEGGDGDGVIHYMRGPVKLIERARSKAQNDYYGQTYPTSASVIDMNRCGLVFNDISTLLRALQVFTDKVKYYHSGNIIGIVRDKNGFKEFIKETQYADIKLNVLIKGNTTANNIIGEVQFLLRTMKQFKDKAHNLYSIQRNEEYMENSVSVILPKLLDEDKQLFIAANMGDIKSICNLMVLNNKSNEEIMKIDEVSGESILVNICSFGHEKIFKFIKSSMPSDLFIGRLFSRNRYNESPIEVAVRKQQILLVQTIFEMREVVQKYEENKDQMYRLCYHLFSHANASFIDRVMTQLSISADLITIFVTDYKYTEENISPSPTVAFASEAFTFNKMSIFCNIAMWKNLESLKKVVSLIEKHAFVENVLISDHMNVNPIEYCIRLRAKEMIEYILSFEEIRKRCVADKELLFRMVFWLNKSYQYDRSLCEYVVNQLGLDESMLKEVQTYRCQPPKNRSLAPNAFKYWKKKIKNESISRLLATKK